MAPRFKITRVQPSASPRGATPATNPGASDLSELGASGSTSYRGVTRKEFNPKLRGKKAIAEYDRVYRSNSKARSAFLLISAPVLSAQWYIQPASDDPLDLDVADFVTWNLNHMRHPLMVFIKEALWSLKYGRYGFEKVYEPTFWRPTRTGAHERPVVRWVDFAPRHPQMLADEWERDENGQPTRIKHTKVGKNGRSEDVWLDRDKMLWYAWDEEADDMDGLSIYRSSTMNAYFQENLYKVDAIQKERHGIGIPRVKLKPGYSLDDKKYANEIGRSLRTNEKAHVTENPSFEVDFIEMKGQPANALESAIHHGNEILANVLGDFAATQTAEGDKKTGARADMFLKALRSLGDFIRMPVNRDAIPELVNYNFTVHRYPELRVRRIAENVEWRTIAVALRNLTEPGLITPEPELEEWIRDQMDFPPPTSKAKERTIEDRLAKAGVNPNREDPGNAATGTSPSGNPTE